MGSIPIKIVDTFFWCIDIASTLKYNSKMQNPPQTNDDVILTYLIQSNI